MVIRPISPALAIFRLVASRKNRWQAVPVLLWSKELGKKVTVCAACLFEGEGHDCPRDGRVIRG